MKNTHVHKCARGSIAARSIARLPSNGVVTKCCAPSLRIGWYIFLYRTVASNGFVFVCHIFSFTENLNLISKWIRMAFACIRPPAPDYWPGQHTFYKTFFSVSFRLDFGFHQVRTKKKSSQRFKIRYSEEKRRMQCVLFWFDVHIRFVIFEQAHTTTTAVRMCRLTELCALNMCMCISKWNQNEHALRRKFKRK